MYGNPKYFRFQVFYEEHPSLDLEVDFDAPSPEMAERVHHQGTRLVRISQPRQEAAGVRQHKIGDDQSASGRRQQDEFVSLHCHSNIDVHSADSVLEDEGEGMRLRSNATPPRDWRTDRTFYSNARHSAGESGVRRSFASRSEFLNLHTWLPLCILVMRILVFDCQATPVQSMQPLFGASLSWAVSSGFRANPTIDSGDEQNDQASQVAHDRSVTFTLHSVFRMAASCNYTLSQPVVCSPSHNTAHPPSQSASLPTNKAGSKNDTCPFGAHNGSCITSGVAGVVSRAQAVMTQHGVLCVGQVVQTLEGTLEFIYTHPHTQTSSDNHACASDSSQSVTVRLFNGSYISKPTTIAPSGGGGGRQGFPLVSTGAPSV